MTSQLGIMTRGISPSFTSLADLYSGGQGQTVGGTAGKYMLTSLPRARRPRTFHHTQLPFAHSFRRLIILPSFSIANMVSPRSLIVALVGAPLLALAQNANPFKIPPGFSATAGQPLDLQWNPTTQGTVTLVLRSGSSNDLAEGTIIACTSQHFTV